MEHRIVPDMGHELTVGDEQIFLAGMYDILMYYPPLDVHWVRYYDAKTKDIMLLVLKDESAAGAILEKTDIPYLIRETIFESEHGYLTQALGSWITDELFDIEDPDDVQ